MSTNIYHAKCFTGFIIKFIQSIEFNKTALKTFTFSNLELRIYNENLNALGFTKSMYTLQHHVNMICKDTQGIKHVICIIRNV